MAGDMGLSAPWLRKRRRWISVLYGEAGGPHRVIEKEFTSVETKGSLDLRFTAVAGAPILSGVEVVAEED